MKKNSIHSIFYFMVGVILLIGPYTFFRVCEVGEKPMKCYWSTKAIGVLAVLLILSAMVRFFVKTVREIAIVNIFVIVTAGLVALIPSVIIGGCGMKTMACHRVTFPAFYIIAIFTILVAVIEMFWKIKYRKREDVS